MNLFGLPLIVSSDFSYKTQINLFFLKKKGPTADNNQYRADYLKAHNITA